MCFSYTLINLRQTPIEVTHSWRSTGSISVFKIAFPIYILLGDKDMAKFKKSKL